MQIFLEDLKKIQRLETLNIELTGIGQRLKQKDSVAFDQLRAFKAKMP